MKFRSRKAPGIVTETLIYTKKKTYLHKNLNQRWTQREVGVQSFCCTHPFALSGFEKKPIKIGYIGHVVVEIYITINIRWEKAINSPVDLQGWSGSRRSYGVPQEEIKRRPGGGFFGSVLWEAVVSDFPFFFVHQKEKKEWVTKCDLHPVSVHKYQWWVNNNRKWDWVLSGHLVSY